MFYCFIVSANILFQATGIQNSHVGANILLVFSYVTYDYGSGYNYATGKFTAPVQGMYAFVKQMCADVNHNAITQFVRDGYNILSSESIAPNHAPTCSSAQVFQYLSKGDQVWVESAYESFFANFGPLRDVSFAGVFLHM